MYSKFGKIIAERFQILNHREEILSGKVKKIRPPSVIPTNPKLATLDLMFPDIPENSTNELTEDFQDRSQCGEQPNHGKRKARRSIAFASQSREEFYKSTDKKIIAPPCGHYDCKYSLVFKSVCVPNFKTPSKTKPRHSHRRVNSVKAPAKEQATIKSTLKEPFEQQLSRPSITKMVNDVNENRFLKFSDMPHVSSKYKRATTPNIGKSPERKPLFMIKESSPDYNPSFKLVTEDLGKVTNFEKYSGRKDMNSSCSKDTREYKPNYAFVEKRVCSPDFRKTSSRPTSAAPLPSYMVSTNWRAAIGVMNEKSLEMNYSIDKDPLLASLYSSN